MLSYCDRLKRVDKVKTHASGVLRWMIRCFQGLLVELIAVHFTALSIRPTRDVSEHDRKQGSTRGGENAEERVGSPENSNRRKESSAGIIARLETRFTGWKGRFYRHTGRLDEMDLTSSSEQTAPVFLSFSVAYEG